MRRGAVAFGRGSSPRPAPRGLARPPRGTRPDAARPSRRAIAAAGSGHARSPPAARNRYSARRTPRARPACRRSGIRISVNACSASKSSVEERRLIVAQQRRLGRRGEPGVLGPAVRRATRKRTRPRPAPPPRGAARSSRSRRVSSMARKYSVRRTPLSTFWRPPASIGLWANSQPSPGMWRCSRGEARMRVPFGVVVVAVLLAAPALAQTSGGGGSDLPDRFQIDTGYFRLNANTVLQLQRRGRATGDVDFERDLGIDADVDTFWVDADVARGPAPSTRAELHPQRTRPGRLHPPARLRVGRRDLQRRALRHLDDRRRHPRRVLPLRRLPQRSLRDRADGRHRQPLAPRGHPGHGHDDASRRDHRHAQPGRGCQHQPRHRGRRRLRERLAHEAAGPSGRLPLHQGQPRKLRSLGDRLAGRGELLLPAPRGDRRAVQVQQVPVRARHHGQPAGRRGHLQGRSGLPVCSCSRTGARRGYEPFSAPSSRRPRRASCR